MVKLFLPLARRGNERSYCNHMVEDAIKNVFTTPCLGQETVEGL
jgi:hypothetical protein